MGCPLHCVRPIGEEKTKTLVIKSDNHCNQSGNYVAYILSVSICTWYVVRSSTRTVSSEISRSSTVPEWNRGPNSSFVLGHENNI